MGASNTRQSLALAVSSEGKQCVVYNNTLGKGLPPRCIPAQNDHGPAVARRAAIPLTVIAVPGCTVPRAYPDSGQIPLPENPSGVRGRQ